MPYNVLNGGKVPVKIWTPLEEVESQALDQLRNVANLPKGATVGSVIAMEGAVSPSAVGVDIGCGMGAVKTNILTKDLPDNLGAIRAKIEELIPVGFNQHDKVLKFGREDMVAGTGM